MGGIMIDSKSIITLTQREQIIKRSAMYLGSQENTCEDRVVWSPTKK